MQAFWKGTIQIAKLQFPAKLYAASEDKGIVFRQQHQACGQPISHLKFCQTCNVPVETGEIRKAYELGGGKFLEIEEEELQNLAPKADKTFRIEHFVRSSEIEPFYMKKHYFVGFETVGAQAFDILHYCLTKMKRTGIGYVTFRSVQQLAAIWASRDGMMLSTLHYADEVRANPAAAPANTQEITPSLLEAFGSLVSGMSVPFEPGAYKNVYNEAVIRLIDSKWMGQIPVEAVPREETEPQEAAADFLSAIQRSLASLGHEETPGLPAKNPHGKKAAK
ncbi:Ku protein [Cohnella sp. CFH 77786]|uniref:non-homologous end joining protein Ku n=1 Tax=Cohnella sp. CFH 77786 TaxID=2662265 RepID=UPI001C609E85|nr:Ku protein [Cohnella sp. CFH 77786]